MSPIQIDGSVLEGGGQILRISTGLSVIMQQPINIEKIRMGRDKPGFKQQHKTGFHLMHRLCGSASPLPNVGDTVASLIPTTTVASGDYAAEIGTAGSCALLVQVALPAALFASGRVNVHCGGGTNADMAPQVDYIQHVFLPVFTRMLSGTGASVDVVLTRRGFFPKGGGNIDLIVNPVTPGKCLAPIDLSERGELVAIEGYAFTSGQIREHVGERMVNSALAILKPYYKKQKQAAVDVRNFHVSQDKAMGDGTGIVIWARFASGCILGASALGSRGVTAEKVGESAGTTLLHDTESGACVDEYLQDQLIIFMALADGKSRVRAGELSLHTQTAIHICSMITNAKFEVIAQPDGTNMIECTGVAHRLPEQ